MRTKTFNVGVFVALLVGASLPAWASPKATSQGLAIAGVTFEGNVPLEAQRLFTERLAEGLSKSELGLRTTGGGKDRTCGDSACFKRAAAELGVSFLVVGKVSENQKNYEIDLELFSGVTGRSSGNHHQRCQICGLSEAGERMSLAASALTERLRSLVHEPGHIVIRTQVAGASVIVNGEPRGAAPQEVTLPAGRHKVRLESTGYRAVERDIEVVPAVDQELLIDMMQIPTQFPYKTVGWSTVGAGVALMAAGVVAFTVFHGQKVTCDVSNKDQEGDCKKILSATWWGAGFMAAGLAASTLGGVWIYLGSQQAGANSTALNVGWQGRF